MIALAILLSFGGLASLALGMSRHYRQVFHREAPRGRLIAVRLAGVLLLTGSFASCLATWDWRQALVAWFGTLSVSGLMVVFALALRRPDR